MSPFGQQNIGFTLRYFNQDFHPTDKNSLKHEIKMTRSPLLAFPPEILSHLLLLVEPSPTSFHELPLVCRQFHETVLSIPISIRCDVTIFTGDSEPDDDDVTETFRIVEQESGSDRFALEKSYGTMVGSEYDIDSGDQQRVNVAVRRLVWRVDHIKIVVNEGIIPWDSNVLISLLKEHVKMKVLGDSNTLRNVRVDFVYVAIHGDPDSPNIANRICNFAKQLNFKCVGLVGNTVPCVQLTSSLPIKQLDFFQNQKRPVQDLTKLSNLAPTLRILTLVSQWRINLRSDHPTFAFGSLNGIEALVNLTNLRICKDCLVHVTENVMRADFSKLKKLKEVWIMNTMSTEAFFKLARTVPSPSILNIRIDLLESPDFFEKCEQQHTNPERIHFEAINTFSLVNVPLEFAELSSAIYRLIKIMPNLLYLNILVQIPHQTTNLHNAIPPWNIFSLARHLDKVSKLESVSLWIFGHVDDPGVLYGMSEVEYRLLYERSVVEMCREEGLRIAVEASTHTPSMSASPLYFHPEILSHIILKVKPSTFALRELPLVFCDAVYSTPISIKCRITISSQDFVEKDDDYSETFKLVQPEEDTYKTLSWPALGTEKLKDEYASSREYGESGNSSGSGWRMTWEVDDVKIWINEAIIPRNPMLLVLLLREYVCLKVLGDTNKMTNVILEFAYVKVKVDLDLVPLEVQRFCNFVKVLNPEGMALVGNTPVFDELKILPLGKLDLFQMRKRPMSGLSALACFAPTLHTLDLGTDWPDPEKAFDSLNGLEKLTKLTELRIEMGNLANISTKLAKIDFTQLKNLALLWNLEHHQQPANTCQQPVKQHEPTASPQLSSGDPLSYSLPGRTISNSHTSTSTELKPLNIEQLHLYQHRKSPMHDLSFIADFAPNLSRLALAGRYRGAKPLFRSLRGIERLDKLVVLTLKDDMIRNINKAVVDFPFENLVNLELLSIETPITAAMFFHLASKVSSPGILDVALDISQNSDFFDRYDELHHGLQANDNICFDDIQKFTLVEVPMKPKELNYIVDRLLNIMPDLLILIVDTTKGDLYFDEDPDDNIHYPTPQPSEIIEMVKRLEVGSNLIYLRLYNVCGWGHSSEPWKQEFNEWYDKNGKDFCLRVYIE
ncbi:hypothetical protein HDU76_011831 [Blyttiomyces sp. JEL0837]|nr:hypothetical protein HDU76_011831 [Blyttiomyces sp. JEL0837]